MQKLFSIILIVFSLLVTGAKGVSCDGTFFVGEKAASERVTDMAVDSLGVVEKTAGAIAQASASGLGASEELASNIGSNVEKGVEGALLIGSLGGKQLVKKAAKAIAKAGKSNLSKTTKSASSATAKSKVSPGKQQMTLSEIKAKNVNNAASKTKPLLGRNQASSSKIDVDVKTNRITREKRWMDLAKDQQNKVSPLPKEVKNDIIRNKGRGVTKRFGLELAHKPKKSNAKGFDYSEALPKYIADHRGLEHRFLKESRTGTKIAKPNRSRSMNKFSRPKKGVLPDGKS